MALCHARPMLDRPDIDDAVLVDAVRRAWRLDVTGVRFMPVGLDGNAWAYEARTAGGDRHFLKMRLGEPAPAAVELPRFLRRHRMTEVVAPVPTADDRPWSTAGRYHLLLYPFIDGDDRWSGGLTDEQWIAYGRFLGTLHTMSGAPAVIGSETFTTTAPQRSRALAGPAARDAYLADFWSRHGGQLAELADETERLAPLAAAENQPDVVCHADIHPGNLMSDATGRLYVVDWDAPIRAPRERDLMFVFGSDFGAHPMDGHREKLFRQGYGPLDINDTVLAYYLYERIVDDVALSMHSILYEGGSETARDNDLRVLNGMFAPGSSVDRANAWPR
jgi:spectinomycin phosphotransferase